ncbi:hypothetical protein N7448_007150, partial [Penicillium atrosanguineum]
TIFKAASSACTISTIRTLLYNSTFWVIGFIFFFTMNFDMERRDAELSDADSLASTAESEQQEEYEVETILFEDEDNGVYLVKWAGYPENRATWEGPESFQNLNETMKDWKQTKRDIRQGLRDPFDIDKWERQQKRLQRNKERRQRERRIKRAKKARMRAARLKKSGSNLLNRFSDDSNKEPSHLGNDDNAQGIHAQRIIDQSNTNLGSRRLFSDDENGSDKGEEPFHPGGDDNAQEIYAPSDPLPEQVSRIESNERGINIDLTAEKDADPPVQGTMSKRPASVRSGSSSSSLFVSEIVPPVLYVSTKTSEANQDEIENHAIQLHRELECQLSQSSPPRTRSRSEQQTGSDQHKKAPRPEEPRPQEHPQQQTTRQEPARQKQSLHHQEISHLPSAQPAHSPRMHEERSQKQQPWPTHLQSKQPSVTARPPPLPLFSEPTPAPSTFGTAPKPTRTVRPRDLRDGWAPDVNDIELLRPSDYSARGDGADSTALTMIRLTATSQPSPSLGNKAKEPSTMTSSSAANSTLIPTGPRLGGSRGVQGGRSAGAQIVMVPTGELLMGTRIPMAEKIAIGRAAPEAEMTAEDHIAEMPVGTFKGTKHGGRMVQGGYFWNQGEVLVHVYFGPGKNFVGIVRLCGLTSGPISELLASKRATGSGVQTEMWFKEVCTKSQYDALCDQTPYNDVSGNAWMEGFHDSNPDLFHLTEYLRAQKSMAIYRPAKQWGAVWLLYSRRSTNITSSLNYDSDRVPAGVPAFLAARPYLPLLLDLEPPRRGDKPNRGRGDFPANVQFRGDHPTRRASLGTLSIPRNDARGNQPDEPTKGSTSAIQSPVTRASDSKLRKITQSSESRMAEQSVPPPADPRLRRRGSVSGSVPESPFQPQPAESTDKERMSRSNVEDGQLMWVGDDFGGTDLMDTSLDIPAGTDPTMMLSPIESAKKEMLDIFRSTYKITLERLSTVSEGTGTGVYSPAHNFYLHLCAEADDETKQDREWLQTWLETFPQIKIFSDWGEFLKTSRGVIMFHESFTLYGKLWPRIREPLWSSRYNFWNYRLSKPLQTADPFFCGEGAHFEPIFTVGHSFLFTEDVFGDLKRALSLIKWFYNMISTSPRVLNYKLMLPPGIMQYLDSRLDQPDLSEEDTKMPGSTSQIHSILIVRSSKHKAWIPCKHTCATITSFPSPPEIIPNWGHRDEEDNPEIPRDLSQDERNMDHLVELFTAWALMRKAHNRKTVVITDSKRQILHRRWENWGHITLFSPNNFMKTFRIDEEAFLAKALGEKRRDYDGRLMPGTTPKTPIDPRTPRPPWQNRTGDGASSPKERRPDNYPASLESRTGDGTSALKEKRQRYPAPYR